MSLETFQLGNLTLRSNLFLSPLAGYTNLPFRWVVREIGGVDLCTTDLVNARSLIERRDKALKLVESNAHDQPLAVQLFGAVPEEMRDAALFLESRGVASIDINMGCPVRKVCRVGGGSAMMTEHGRTQHLVRTMVEALRIPVTAKMRLGWDDDNITAPELARALEDVGVAAVFVHGRTREQGFGGRVNLDGIRRVVRAVRRIPVIGNGDVTTPEAARHMLEETGCAGIGIGRGAFYDPWIFARTRRLLATGESPPEPTFAERVRVMCLHLDRMIEVFGEPLGCLMFRKIAPWYGKRFGPVSEFNRHVVRICTRAEFHDVLERYRRWRVQFCDADGELLERFRPGPMVASFLLPQTNADPSATRREAIPVPKGPVDNW
ncbi:MAG: tRNA dihydrouridine synthase DusB [Verrucomicrobiales bacterium]|nr:tRNA dihydrouridine synthase DusB [Verrucomicrobiales bacterium]